MPYILFCYSNVGAASATHYSITVTAQLGQSALTVVDKALEVAKQRQARLATCSQAIENVTETMQLAERKLGICRKLIIEAETEGSRCRASSAALVKVLDKDDIDMILPEKERNEKERELRLVNAEADEYLHAAVSRAQEYDDVERGLADLRVLLLSHTDEKKVISQLLDKDRSEIPGCILLLRGDVEASNVAATLNCTVPTELIDDNQQSESIGVGIGGIGGEGGNVMHLDGGRKQSQTDILMSGILQAIVSPAVEVRKKLKRVGFSHLSQMEQQWCLLDQTLNPGKYEWLREQEEKDKMKYYERIRLISNIEQRQVVNVMLLFC